jgi:hypothetical protein
MNIEFIINNTAADYKEIDTIPFQFDVAFKDFEKIGSVESVELSNVVKLLAIPATKNNKNIFANREGQSLPLKVIKNGKQVFSGQCILQSKTSKQSKLLTLNLDVFGGNGEIWERLEGVSLRSLELGEAIYQDTAIVDSWGDDVDTNPILYAPVIYGKLDSNTEDVWSVEDMRPSIYFETILKGIEDYLNITIESNLRNSPLWKQSVELFTVGQSWENAIPYQDFTATAVGGETDLRHFLSANTFQTVWNIDIYFAAGGTNGTVTVTIGDFVDTFSYTGSEFPMRYYGMPIVGNGIDKIKIETTGTFAAGTKLRSVSTKEVIIGSKFNIASCLQDKPVKTFLKDIFTMFNLVSFYNPVTKILRLDSMFNHTVDSLTYDGFYNVPTPVLDAKLNTAQVIQSTATKAGTVRLQYKKNDAVGYLVDKQTQIKNLALNSTETVINQRNKIDTYTLDYQNLFLGTVNYLSSIELPMLLDEDTEFQNTPIDILKPTFLSNRTCAMVTGETIPVFNFESTNYNNVVPIICQTNNRYEDFPYSLSFADVTAESVTAQGLTTLFYLQYFQTLKNFKKISTTIRLSDVLNVDNYRNVVKFGNDLLLLTMLKNVQLNKRTFDCELIQYRSIDSDIDIITHNTSAKETQIIKINEGY